MYRAKIFHKKVLFSRKVVRDLTLYLPWISILCIIGGYVHVSIVYGYFGVPSHHFFSINDYLAISLDQIMIAGIALLAVLVMLAFMVAPYMVGKPTITRQEQEIKVKKWKWGFYIGIILILFSGLYGDNFWLFVALIPIVGSTAIASFTRKFFENWRFVYMLICFPLMFVVVLCILSSWKIDRIKNNQNYETFNIDVENNLYNEEKSRFIGSNSRYVFVLNDDDSVDLVPLTNIRSMSFKEKQASSWIDRVPAITDIWEWAISELSKHRPGRERAPGSEAPRT